MLYDVAPIKYFLILQKKFLTISLACIMPGHLGYLQRHIYKNVQKLVLRSFILEELTFLQEVDVIKSCQERMRRHIDRAVQQLSYVFNLILCD